eukprot:scaffold94293_cov22-Tisochrysis_lutea.AAC.2
MNQGTCRRKAACCRSQAAGRLRPHNALIHRQQPQQCGCFLAAGCLCPHRAVNLYPAALATHCAGFPYHSDSLFAMIMIEQTRLIHATQCAVCLNTSLFAIAIYLIYCMETGKKKPSALLESEDKCPVRGCPEGYKDPICTCGFESMHARNASLSPGQPKGGTCGKRCLHMSMHEHTSCNHASTKWRSPSESPISPLGTRGVQHIQYYFFHGLRCERTHRRKVALTFKGSQGGYKYAMPVL